MWFGIVLLKTDDLLVSRYEDRIHEQAPWRGVTEGRHALLAKHVEQGGRRAAHHRTTGMRRQGREPAARTEVPE